MKQLPRFFITKSAIKRKRFLIEDALTARHMRLVLRLKKGARIVLFDGEGGEYNATLGFLSLTQAAGVVDEVLESKQTSKPAVFLAQALPRAGKMDGIVRMNTELGVQGFVLFDSEYSVAKKEAYSPEKMKRLQRVTIEALRQSEGAIMPDLYGPMGFSEALDFKADHKFLLHSRMTQGVADLYQLKKKVKPGEIVLVFIGPEGGFSPAELELAAKKGAQLVYLDLPVLRTETAGVVVDAILLS
jgi:16S rRNA (uracil1498-N3)-methyltransferase